MSELKNFIVYGPGRTGSHWVESILSDLYGQGDSGFRAGGNLDVKLMPDRWIYHTNSLERLREVQLEVRKSVTLIYCNRKNYFDAIMSLYICYRTGEWYDYTDNLIHPFTIDVTEFNNRLTGYYSRHAEFNQLTQEELHDDLKGHTGVRYPKIITIEYEDLVNSEIPEKYIAERLGLEYEKTQCWSQVGSKKNPRNYKDLILNWDELLEIYEKKNMWHKNNS